MRLRAYIHNHPEYQKIILCECEEGSVYLFPCRSREDGSGAGDWFYQSVAEAKESATEYGVTEADWVEIDDPLPGALWDCEAPMVSREQPDGSRMLLPYDEQARAEYEAEKRRLKEIKALTGAETRAEIGRLIETGQKLAAIRLHLQRFEAGLGAAKYVVDEIEREMKQKETEV